MENTTPVNILLIDDDLGDQKLIKTSLRAQKIANKVFSVESAEDALLYLELSEAHDPVSPLPDIILLDLNMPGMGGKAFLKEIKNSPNLSRIPVVILTTSDAEEDILESYQLNAAGYVKKPVTLEGFQKALGTLEDYWFVLCKTTAQRKQACQI